MTTEKIWKELIETGKELHEKTKDKRLPGEVSFREFAEENDIGKDMARAVLKHLLDAGLIKVRVCGNRKYYSPKN